MTANELRNKVASLDAVPTDKGWDADNLGIALATYYSKHPDRPADDKDDTELGWGAWVMAQTNDALDRIIATVAEAVE
jgi:hypothetical protein